MGKPSSLSSVRPWIYRPGLDLIIGCGGWSAPLLLLGTLVTPSRAHAWGAAFYLLAFVFNYPHFMATVYRAYHTREDFAKYRIFTVHLTLLLVLTAIFAHASFRLVPWVFTLYACWSPWHYTGQNFGLLMMFLRRGGAEVSALERGLLHLAFVASYLMLLVSFHTGPSNDPLILSLNLPSKVALPARIILGGAFAVLSMLAFDRLARRSRMRALVAPFTLLLSQLLWFVLPTLLELRSGAQIPQTRYSSGILAVLHSAQYLWITSYYAKREATTAKTTWRMSAYFIALVAGGIALFVPGPWLVSYIFHYDFTVSFLIFTALVNIHHFILDGAIWKLRDTRIASLLIDRGGRAATAAGDKVQLAIGATRWLVGSSSAARVFRYALVGLLLIWGAMDQVHYFFVTDAGNLSHLMRAASLNPYDSSLQLRLARAESQAGKLDEAVKALTRAVATNPKNPLPQQARARALVENGRYVEAYEHYKQMLAIFPRDPDALISFGLLARGLGHTDEAIGSWRKAVEADSARPNAHLYLAETLDRMHRPAEADPQYEAYMRLVAAHPDQSQLEPGRIIVVMIEWADAIAHTNQPARAAPVYQTATTLAEKIGQTKLQSLAFAHLGDLHEKAGQTTAAAHCFQHGLTIDARASDPRSEAFDWFNYGQFLRRHGQPQELAYACFLRAEDLLGADPGQELETVKGIREQAESQLGRRASDVRKDLPTLLAKAASLEDSAFSVTRKSSTH